MRGSKQVRLESRNTLYQIFQVEVSDFSTAQQPVKLEAHLSEF